MGKGFQDGLLGKEEPLAVPADVSDLFHGSPEAAPARLSVNVGLIDLIYSLGTPRSSFIEERVSLFCRAPNSDLEQVGRT